MTAPRLAAAAEVAAGLLAPLQGRAIHVSGGTGFLASNLLALLHAASEAGDLGLRLHASARGVGGARPDLPLFAFYGIEPDIAWQAASVEATRLPDEPGLVVVHAASFGAPADYLREPVATFRANTDGLLGLYAQAAALGAAHVVFFSSAEVYGQPPAEALPTPEGFGGGPALGTPRSIYGEAKRMGEVLGASQAAATGIPFTAVRPFNLFGPGQRPGDGRVPLAFARMALEDRTIVLHGDGRPRRSPCAVLDGMLQIAACLAPDPRRPVRAYNIGDPTGETSMADLARRCAAAAGLDDDAVELGGAQDGAPARAVPDVRAVLQLAGGGWMPAFSAPDAALAELIDWLQWTAVRA